MTAQNMNGSTPMYVAAQQGHASAVRLCAELGGDINAPQQQLITPIRTAADHHHLSVVKELLLLGASTPPSLFLPRISRTLSAGRMFASASCNNTDVPLLRSSCYQRVSTAYAVEF